MGVANAALVVALGDLNDVVGSPALEQLDIRSKGHMVELGYALLDDSDRSSFVFGPNGLDLDHVLVSGRCALGTDGAA